MRPKQKRAAAISFATLVLLAGCGMAEASSSKEVSVQANCPSLSNDMIGQLTASIMGESALVDKETGRVLWEGGTSTLSASLAPILGNSIKHMRATILTGVLLLAIIGSIVARIRRSLFAETAGNGSRSWPVSALLFVADWTILNIPQVHGNVLITAIVLYLIESYTCSTRRYLANSLSSPLEVEEYIELLREEPPVVTWKVRCFHYERRKWLSLLRFLTMRKDEQSDLLSSTVPSSPWMFTKKVVTHQAQSYYNFTSCEDKTIAGVWRRAEATAANPAPFSKIVLSKLLILPNTKAREDYFKQQSSFVTREGRDEYTEFSTSIQVKGFRRRMLAVRPVEGVPSTKLFRLHLFWFFTLVGLTVPYRIWFARHCDELRVTVAKETAIKSASSTWSWFSKSTYNNNTEWNKEFKSKMRELALYTRDRLALTEMTNATKPELPPIPRKEDVDVKDVAQEGTSTETLSVEVNATETKAAVESDQEKHTDLPPPSNGDGVTDAGDATDSQATDESPTNHKEE